MIINYKQTRVLIVAKKNRGSFTIVPGINIIDGPDWDEIKGTIKDRIGDDRDIITVVKVTKGPGGKEQEVAAKVTELDPQQAECLIQSVASLDVIDKWLKLEGRDGIRAQLFKRQAEIKDATAPARSE